MISKLPVPLSRGRRECSELCVDMPQVITKEVEGETCESYEIDIPEEHKVW